MGTTEQRTTLDREFAEEFTRRYGEAWESRDPDRLAELCTEDVVWTDPALKEPLHGRDGVRRFVRESFRMAPDFRVEMLDCPYLSPSRPRILAPYRMQGTMTGPWVFLDMAPTGRAFTIAAVGALARAALPSRTVSAHTDIFDLGRLQLSSGAGRSVDLLVKVDTFEFGGQSYQVSDDLTDARLDATRTVSGYSLRLRFEAELDGPCMRCLEAAAPMVDVDAREVDQPGGGEDLSSPYIEGDELDVHAWARDSLALALPAQIVCSEDCLGLCPVCGTNLNEAGPDHAHEEEPDPRWAKLSELKFE